MGHEDALRARLPREGPGAVAHRDLGQHRARRTRDGDRVVVGIHVPDPICTAARLDDQRRRVAWRRRERGDHVERHDRDDGGLREPRDGGRVVLTGAIVEQNPVHAVDARLESPTHGVSLGGIVRRRDRVGIDLHVRAVVVDEVAPVEVEPRRIDVDVVGFGRSQPGRVVCAGVGDDDGLSADALIEEGELGEFDADGGHIVAQLGRSESVIAVAGSGLGGESRVGPIAVISAIGAEGEDLEGQGIRVSDGEIEGPGRRRVDERPARVGDDAVEADLELDLAAEAVARVVEADVGAESVVILVQSDGDLRIGVDAHALRVGDAIEADRSTVAVGDSAIAAVALGWAEPILHGRPGQVRDIDRVGLGDRLDVADDLDRLGDGRRSVRVESEEKVVPDDQDVRVRRERQREGSVAIVDGRDGKEALVGVQVVGRRGQANHRE